MDKDAQTGSLCYDKTHKLEVYATIKMHKLEVYATIKRTNWKFMLR